MSNVKSIDRLVQGICSACERNGFSFEIDPEELLKTETKSSKLLSAISPDKVNAYGRKKSLSDWGVDVLRGLYVHSHSHYAIQVGSLDDSLQKGVWTPCYREQCMNRWHAYQQLAAIARTWLLTDFSDDLNLFLVGPPGSSSESEWINFAQTIERNDLVCRKLVWLPSRNEFLWGQEIRSLLERSFLAKPWLPAASTSVASLDSVSDISSSLKEWSEVLDDPAFVSDDRDYDTLIATLLEKFKR
jgi:hypothetical protein